MTHINFKEAFIITQQCRLLRPKLFCILLSYYFMTVVNALLDGVGMVLLVSLISGNAAFNDLNPLMLTIQNVMKYFGYSVVFKTILFLTVILFMLRVVVNFAVWAYDGISSAYIRRNIQEKGFARLLNGNWEDLRHLRVGKRVGALSEESVITAKYITSFTRLIYHLIAAFVLVGISLSVSLELTLLMMCVGIPIIFLLKYLFVKQSQLSARQTKARQSFTADIAERIATLFQIKVEGDNEHYIRDGLRSQQEMTRAEMHLGIWHAMITAFSVFIPAFALMVLYLWALWQGKSLVNMLHLIAAIGIVGARIVAQVNGVIGSWGNLARLSGSIIPVYNLFLIPQEPKRQLIKDKLVNIQLDNVSYRYDGGAYVNNISVNIVRGLPLLIRGPSGSGKTTIANLMAGVLKPVDGKIVYVGKTGNCYNAADYKANVGYVTQDIYLFHGTIRENLAASRKNLTDNDLWNCLENVGADDFVRSLGGLDATITEAGRSLSGGERRRLGIARVLAGRPDFLIFDEVTAGLDSENKGIVYNAVMKLSQDSIVTVITHEETFNSIENSMSVI